jgi:hypothetical protein
MDINVSEIEMSEFISMAEFVPTIQDNLIAPEYDIFLTISYTKEALECLRRLSSALEKHEVARDILENIDQSYVPGLDRIFEQKLAMYVKMRVRSNKEWDIYIVTYDDVIDEVNNLIRSMFCTTARTNVNDRNIYHMLIAYPMQILSTVCVSDFSHSYVMGESVKKLIEIRKTNTKWLPVEVQLCAQGNTNLVGADNSPLTEMELEALYRYLGSRKQIYVHILLNSLFELSRDKSMLDGIYLTEDQIIKICGSSWFYLFLLDGKK